MLAADVLESGTRRWPSWVACVVAVLLLHAGIVFWAAFSSPREETEDEVAGAITMELAPTLLARRVETTDTALGPQSEEAVATPPTTEKVDDLRPLDIPQFEQSPLAPEPEVSLPIAKPVEETPPKEEELKELQPENLAPQQTATAEAMAPPQIMTREATVNAAPQIGEVTKDSQSVLTFQKFIRLHVKKNQRYPGESRDRGEQGIAIVEFAIDRAGKLVDRKLIASTGYAKLDEEAVATIDRSNPFPLPPDDEPGEQIRFSLKIQFKIK